MAIESIPTRASSKEVKDIVDANFTELSTTPSIKDRGTFDASGNVFPSTGGSGVSGAILKGDMWMVSAVGSVSGARVGIGTTLRALTDSPGQTNSNWIIENGMPFGTAFCTVESLQVMQIPQTVVGPGALGRPIEFINVGYTGAEPASTRHNAPCGFTKSNWSMCMFHNWKWDFANNRPTTANTSFPSSLIEAGGEGISQHVAATGTNWYDGGTMTVLTSGNGPRGIPGFTSGRVIQHMGTIYGHYSSSSYQSGKLRSWEGGTEPIIFLHLEEAKGTDNELARFEANSGTAAVYAANYYRKSRGTYETKTAVATNDILGLLGFKGYEGDEYVIGAGIRAIINGTVSNNTLPTQLEFQTTTTNSPTTRMTILPNGNVILHALPTASAGLATGTLWNDSGTLKVA